MRSKYVHLLITSLIFAILSSYSNGDGEVKMRISSLSLNSARVQRFEKFEVTFNVDGDYQNPFDPDEINIIAKFKTPKGESIAVTAFWYQESHRKLEDGKEVLESEGDPVWKVRFTPTEIGEHGFQIVAFDKESHAVSERRSFECIDAKANDAQRKVAHGVKNADGASQPVGFIRRSKNDYRYFEFDSGAPFFMIGQNLCWPGAAGTYQYDDWLAKMEKNGENLARVWIQRNHACELERPPDPETGEGGVGRYDLANAWRLDYVLTEAKKRGISIMLCTFDFYCYHERFVWNKNVSYPFKKNPYNADNGGPCVWPEDFFTKKKPRDLVLRLLRYLVARYGYATNLFAWEFFNEVDLFPFYRRTRHDVVLWHREMSSHLRLIDPYDHIITTSYASVEGDWRVWQMPDIDMTQSHNYGAQDMGRFLPSTSRKMTFQHKKPTIYGEFGCDSVFVGKRMEQDPTGIHLHNGIWASALSGASGTALSWWWDNFIDPRDLYTCFKPLSEFLSDVSWTTAQFKESRVKISLLNPNDTVQVDPPEINAYLHGRTHRRIRTAPTFHVDYPDAGKFVVHVDKVSAQGHLLVELDGKVVLEKALPAGEKKGQWKKRQWQRRWRVWLATYDRDFSIDVPDGKHSIRIENTGRDWILLNSIAFKDYLKDGSDLRIECRGEWGPPRFSEYAVMRDGTFFALGKPNLRVVGLQGRDLILLWIQNKNHTWKNMSGGKKLRPHPRSTICLSDLSAGEYVVELWNTYSGDVIQEYETVPLDGALEMELPEIGRDVAMKIWRQE